MVVFRLLRYFSLTALVSLAFAAAALTVLFDRAAEADLLSSAEHANGMHARVFANALNAELGTDVWRYLRDEAPHLNADQLRAHPMTARMHKVLRQLATGTSVAKVKLFSLDGVTLYSSQPSQIGERTHGLQDVQRARNGELASTLEERSSFNSFDGDIFKRSLISTYIPAIEPGSEAASAVFELYADLTPLKQAVDRASSLRLLIVVSVMAVLFLAQYLIVWRGSAIIRRQQLRLEATGKELEHARQTAVHANAAKSRFLANMSHEIRTPMHGVLGMADLLLKTSLNDVQRRYAQTITRSGQGLMTILNDILDLTKIEAGQLQLDPHPLDLREVVLGVCDLMGAQASAKGLALEADIPPDLATRVEGDGLRMQQVLHNLVGNAIKFTRYGHVRVTVRAGERAGDYRFTVSDTGIGIEPAVAQRLFAPFVQADNSTSREFGGTGLGLAISRELVVLMGGTMDLNSTPGEGSAFSFTLHLPGTDQMPESLATLQLPAARERASQPLEPVAPEARRLAPAAGAWVPPALLLVDDDAVNVLYAQAVLLTLNVRVVVANDGMQALAAVGKESFALILMDCNMPGMDGLTATRRIRELETSLGRLRTPIVALTASAMEEEREQCFAAGMDDFLAKPFRADELRAVISPWFADL